MRNFLKLLLLILCGTFVLSFASAVMNLSPLIDDLISMSYNDFFTTGIKQQNIDEDTDTKYTIVANKDNLYSLLNGNESLTFKNEIESLYKDVKKDLSLIEDFYGYETYDNETMDMYIQVVNSEGKYIYITSTLHFENDELKDIVCYWHDGSIIVDTINDTYGTLHKTFKAKSLKVGKNSAISMYLSSNKKRFDVSKKPSIIEKDGKNVMDYEKRLVVKYCDSFFTDCFTIEKVESGNVTTSTKVKNKIEDMSVNEYNDLFNMEGNISDSFTRKSVLNYLQEYTNNGNYYDVLVFGYEFKNPSNQETKTIYVEIGFDNYKYNGKYASGFSYYKIYQNGNLTYHIALDNEYDDYESCSAIKYLEEFIDIELKGYNIIPTYSTYVINADSTLGFTGVIDEYCIRTSEEDLPSDLFSQLFYYYEQY